MATATLQRGSSPLRRGPGYTTTALPPAPIPGLGARTNAGGVGGRGWTPGGVPGTGSPVPTSPITPTVSPAAAALASPVPISVTTPVDPKQAAATKGWETYSSELQAGTAAETERELQRFRDELSTGLQSEGEAAIVRGADPSLFRSRALESGKRGLLELQGRLADVSLNKRAEALSGLTTAAGAAAAERRMLHLGSLSAQQEAQRTLLEQAALQARLQEAPYERLLKLMGEMGQYGGAFEGLSGPTMTGGFKTRSYPSGGLTGGGGGGALGTGRVGSTPR